MAAGATVLLAAVAVAAVAVADVAVTQRLQGEVDVLLLHRLHGLAVELPEHEPAGATPAVLPAGGDLDDSPVLMWRLDAAGRVMARTAGAPALPAVARTAAVPVDVSLAGIMMRVDHLDLAGGGRLVAAQSLAQPLHARRELLVLEALAAPVVLAAIYLAALVIGMRASAPVELARRRQLEFTADASHELRTPLTVIEAEVDLALRARRDEEGYRDALARIGGESDRLRRIVDDLLWLARFDSEPAPPAHEPVDLQTMAGVCVERFGPLAAAKELHLGVQARGRAAVRVKAPPEWIDRLIGVLVDNAIRYTPRGGRVAVTVGASGGRAWLAVDDSGPGIAPDARATLFDRFHRASDVPGGSGLGLAIADSVVRSTHARWTIGTSPTGGAHMEVSWPQGSSTIVHDVDAGR